MTKRKNPEPASRSPKMTVELPPLPALDTAQRYTLKEAMRYLRTSHQTIHNMIKSGELATIQEGVRRYVPGTEIARRSRL